MSNRSNKFIDKDIELFNMYIQKINDSKLDEDTKKTVVYALQKNIPIDAIEEERYSGIWECGRCRHFIEDFKTRDGLFYCSHCGQKILPQYKNPTRYMNFLG